MRSLSLQTGKRIVLDGEEDEGSPEINEEEMDQQDVSSLLQLACSR